MVVDKDVNVQDTDEVWFRVGSSVDPKRDITFVDGPVDVLDHAAPLLGAGSKWGLTPPRNGRKRDSNVSGRKKYRCQRK